MVFSKRIPVQCHKEPFSVSVGEEEAVCARPDWLCLAVDWIVADILAVRQNALGHVRYVLKDGLKWLPLYGCYFARVTFPFIRVFILCLFCFVFSCSGDGTLDLARQALCH
jgi:hypothetical protein